MLINIELRKAKGKKLSDSEILKPIPKPGEEESKITKRYGINSPFTAEEREEFLELIKHGNRDR